MVVKREDPTFTSNTHFGMPYSYLEDADGQLRDYNGVVDADMIRYFRGKVDDPEQQNITTKPVQKHENVKAEVDTWELHAQTPQEAAQSPGQVTP